MGADEDYAPGAVLLPLILRTLTPMAQQDKISVLGLRDDGTYVVEFRTAAGERLAISVPGSKATVLKHFQAATAEPHAPIPDGGVMTGIVKPEIRNVLQIGWMVVRGILELAIMVYILRSMLEPADTVIVAVLGIIYATIRSTALFQHFTMTQMAWAGDRQSLEQRLGENLSVDSEIANTDESGKQYIETIWGRGYVLREPSEDEARVSA
jgi:hypothetical protein